MADIKRRTKSNILISILQALWRSIAPPITLFVVFAMLIGLLQHFDVLNDFASSLWIGAALFIAMFVFLVLAFRRFAELRTAARARETSEEIAEVLGKFRNQASRKNVAEISTQEVAAALTGTKVSNEHVARLVEQGKQQLLVDDEYFLDELSSLIVDYLQPLPRNAKRLLNRFRVNLLIAHSRGLLSSDPKVTAQQIGKWLVLVERWPQLGRSLSAAPENMANLEEQSKNPAPSKSAVAKQDSFMESIKILASPYFGDEDLRKFIKSDPSLQIVLPRLVYYGPAEPLSTVALPS